MGQVKKILLDAVADGKIDVFFDGHMQLIPRSGVGTFLGWIEGRMTILGAEGFAYSDGMLTALADCIIDSSEGEAERSVLFHKRIITTDPTWRKADFVEFVFNLDNGQDSKVSH